MKRLCIAIGILACAPAALADSQQIARPGLQQYLAPEPPPLTINERLQKKFWFLDNFYVNAQVGYGSTKLSGFNGGGNDGSNQTLSKTDESKNLNIFGGAFGYAFPNSGFRVEAEYVYRGKVGFSTPSPNITKNTGNVGNVVGSLNSDITSQTLMLKIYYDLHDIIPVRWIVPYAMAGAGLAFNNTDTNVNISLPTVNTAFTNSKSNTSSEFTWTVGAGVNFPLNEHFTIGLEYAYANLGKAEIQFDPGLTTIGFASPTTMSFKSDKFTQHSGVLHFLWKF